MRRAPIVRLVRDALIMLGVSFCILGVAEIGLRVAVRIGGGAWAQTRAAALDDARRATAVLYRRHPFLFTAAREGARDPRAARITVNSLGYRSPERPRSKPAGVARVVCAGGSTTWDPWAATNASTWTSRLEENLRATGREVEVWNAGFPGWTSLENLISLAIRDLELSPDVVVLYQGINDLQPASHEPVEPDYAGFHADMQLSLIGIGAPALPWYHRLLLVERAGDLFIGRSPGSFTGRPPTPQRLRGTLLPDGVRVFDRNVRSLVGLARAHGARVLLVTQHLQQRARHWNDDRTMLSFAAPDLDPDAAVGGIERLNDVLRAFGAAGEADVADVSRDVAWTDADFVDPMHTNAAGSQKLADALTEPVARSLARLH